MAQKSAQVFGSRPAVAVISVIVTTVVLSGGLSALAQGAAELVGANQVNSASIVNGAIVSADIAENGVNSRNIKGNAVHTDDIRDGDVISADILDGTVGPSDLGASVVGNNALGTVTQRSVNRTLPPGGNDSVTANCLAGEQVLSGGNDGSFDMFVVASRQNGNGWTVFLHNDSAANRSVTAHVYCLQP